MKNTASNQHGSPPNCPTGGDVFTKMLELMTEEELTDGLNEALDVMTEENYDSALIDAYLAALDRKAPMPEVPDADTSFSNFKKRLLSTFSIESGTTVSPRHRMRSVWCVALIAALSVICLMGSMVVAQASGVDILGSIARWTDDVFSLGAIRSDGADDGTNSTTSAGGGTSSDEVVYASFQEALDAYGITEFCEPAWIPDGYKFNNVKVKTWPDDGSLIGLYAEYYDGSNFLNIQLEYYAFSANVQVEKVDTSVESFTTNGLTVYLLENINNNSAAWVTEHYECYIIGTVEKQELKQMVLSAYAQLQ